MAFVREGKEKLFGLLQNGLAPVASNECLDRVGLGLTNLKTIIEAKIDWNNVSTDAWIAVMNDFDYSITKLLVDKGYENIAFICTDRNIFNMYKTSFWAKASKAINYNDSISCWKKIVFVEVAEYEVQGKKRTSTKTKVSIEGDNIKGLKFNYIIANPPFSLGKEITAAVKNSLDFDSYINLMPISEYERTIDNSKITLSNYESEYQQLSKQESLELFDCNCPPLEIGIIKKDIQNNYSKLDRLCRKDSFLNKWYNLNKCRILNFEVYSHILNNSRYGIKEHAAAFCPASLDSISDEFFNSSIVFGMYFVSNGIHCDEGNAIDTFWNYKLSSITEFKAKVLELNAAPDLHCLKFNSHIEKVNCDSWMRNQKLYSYILRKLDNAGSIDVIKDIVIPKVDWTHAWTDEEILRDYGYTEEEIAEILA